MDKLYTNDLKKGDKVQLANGWKATIMDNKKGNTRLAEVQGYFTEIGSVYAHDIVFYFEPTEGNRPISITHTDAQKKLKQTVSAL